METVTTQTVLPPPRAAFFDERKFAAMRAGIVVLLSLVALAVTLFVRLPGVPTCAFKLWTGYPCPGCGMTRSVLRLARGDVLESIRFHPLGLVVAALAAAVLVGGVAGALTGRDPVWRFLDRRGTWLGLGVVAALIGVWVVRTVVVPEWSPDPIGDSFFLRR